MRLRQNCAIMSPEKPSVWEVPTAGKPKVGFPGNGERGRQKSRLRDMPTAGKPKVGFPGNGERGRQGKILPGIRRQKSRLREVPTAGVPTEGGGKDEARMLTEKKKEFIEFMLSAQVLRFGNFVTKSGRNTQYFVNTGNYKTGAQLARLGSYYAALVKETVGDQFEAMFGPAYKGIPLATACAIALYRDHGIDRPYFFNRKEVKDHGEGGGTVGYAPQDGDRIIIIEDVITAGTAVRETMPILKACADVKVPHMFISVDRCEVGHTPGKTAIMEVEEEFGVKVHPIVTVVDIHEYLKANGTDPELIKAMEGYMDQYCVL